MSSFVRRIQRTVAASRPHVEKVSGTVEYRVTTNPARGKGYMGRGSKLGVTNPKARDLLARQVREAKRAEARA